MMKMEITDIDINNELKKHSIQDAAKKYGNTSVYKFITKDLGRTKYYLYGTKRIITKEQLQDMLIDLLCESMYDYYIYSDKNGMIWYDSIYHEMRIVTKLTVKDYKYTVKNHSLSKEASNRYDDLYNSACTIDKGLSWWKNVMKVGKDK